MKFPWKIVRVTHGPADVLLEDIKNILFPQLQLHKTVNEEGSEIKYHIDKSIDSNLDAALIDLIEGNNDQISQTTIENAIKKLKKIRNMLEAHVQLDSDALYIIVEDDTPPSPEIIAADG